MLGTSQHLVIQGLGLGACPAGVLSSERPPATWSPGVYTAAKLKGTFSGLRAGSPSECSGGPSLGTVTCQEPIKMMEKCRS